MPKNMNYSQNTYFWDSKCGPKRPIYQAFRKKYYFCVLEEGRLGFLDYVGDLWNVLFDAVSIFCNSIWDTKELKE